MENPLWSDIHRQSENLSYVVQHLYGAERTQLEEASRFLRNERPIIFAGVASAAYLCAPAEFYLGQHGRVSATLCASDAYYSLLPALRKANVVVNSRSGETAEIVRLAQALTDEGIPFVAITNEPQSTLAKLARYVVWSNTHRDDLVSINVVTGMMTTTLALAASVCGELDSLYPQFNRLCRFAGEVVSDAVEQRSLMGAFFEGVRPIYLLYRGHSRGSALCGRLVLEEVARTPSVVLEGAEFRQGPNEVIDERFGAVVFCGAGKQGELNRSLARDIQNSGGRVMLVGETGAVTGGQKELVFPIAGWPDFLRPVLEVIPVQLLAYELALAQGYTPGQTRYITKVIRTEEGIPNQS